MFIFPLYFLEVSVYTEHLCRPSEAHTQYCVILGGFPPQDWQSLPSAGEELDSNPGLLICSQVRYYWTTSPPPHMCRWLTPFNYALDFAELF